MSFTPSPSSLSHRRRTGSQRRAGIRPTVSARTLAPLVGLAVGLAVLPFQVRADGWEPRVEISSGTSGWWYPQVAVQGNYVHVVWRDAAGLTVQYRRSTDGGTTWDPIQTLHSTGGTPFPRIAVSGPYVHVVWGAEASAVTYCRSTDYGATFSAKNTIGTGYLPDVAVEGQYVYVAWGNAGDVYFRRNTSNGMLIAWDFITQRFTTDGLNSDIRVAASSQRAYVAWIKSGSPNNSVLFRRSNADWAATWTDPALTLWTTGTASISITAYGTNVFVDKSAAAPQGPVQRKSTDSGATFAAAVSIGAGTDKQPEVHASSAYTGNGANVYFRSASLYVSTGTAAETLIGATIAPTGADIGANDDGNMHVACGARDAADLKDKIYYHRYVRTRTFNPWQPPRPSPACGRATPSGAISTATATSTSRLPASATPGPS